jgi:MoxR-like ATPase
VEVDVMALNAAVKQESGFVEKMLQEVSKVVVGQTEMVEGIVMGLLTGGHVLLEGVPGLAKTLTISSVSQAISLNFQRVQFTPDLLPSDLIGTMIFNPKSGEFTPKKGPIFTNILLADEINRAPAKVQSALLESMAEKQVTIGDTTYGLEKPFLVLATQNPLEQEGTYPLPEAQMDRFMFKIMVDYPTKGEELEIMNRMATDQHTQCGGSDHQRESSSCTRDDRQNLCGRQCEDLHCGSRDGHTQTQRVRFGSTGEYDLRGGDHPVPPLALCELQKLMPLFVGAVMSRLKM